MWGCTSGIPSFYMPDLSLLPTPGTVQGSGQTWPFSYSSAFKHDTVQKWMKMTRHNPCCFKLVQSFYRMLGYYTQEHFIFFKSYLACLDDGKKCQNHTSKVDFLCPKINGIFAINLGDLFFINSNFEMLYFLKWWPIFDTPSNFFFKRVT